MYTFLITRLIFKISFWLMFTLGVFVFMGAIVCDAKNPEQTKFWRALFDFFKQAAMITGVLGVMTIISWLLDTVIK